MTGRLIGLELAEESVRAVEVTGGREPMLVAAGEVLLPSGAARDSEVLDVDAVAMALTQLWVQSKFKSRKVVLSVASRRLLVREYTAPNLPPDQLKAALPYEAQDLLPVPADQAVLDFYPLEIEGKQAKGLLVAGAAEGIEGMIAAVRKAKLWVADVDFLPFGLARVVGRVIAAGFGPVAVAAIGEHTTSFVVATDGIPQYARIIPVDVMAGLHATMAARGEFGEAGPAATARRASSDAAPGLDPSVQDLVGRLRDTLNFCRRNGQRLSPRKLYITGALALVPEVQAALTDGLGIEIQPLVPTEVIPVASDLTDKDLPASLVGALGVTLGVAKS
jgi:type IV pilus assembly protein PilM